MRKDKQKVVGEPMTDEQVAVFLDFRPADPAEPVGHYMLTRAYRGLRAHDFARFLSMFQAAGHDVSAVDAHGHSFAQTISDHAQAEDYLAALQAAQAGTAN